MKMGNGRLKDKVALIVGAGQQPGESIGNGRAVAERCWWTYSQIG
jgi:NAD(P)-dependent dehydrogenase (short-subunit alcohol dehydrogenase family)